MEEYPSPAEGTGLENREIEKSVRGFKSLFLRHCILTSQDRAVWQLVGLITQRSVVQIHLLQPSGSVVQRLSHSPVTRGIAGSIPVGTAIYFGFIAQLAEHKTENLGVVGSIPTEATILKIYFVRKVILFVKKQVRSQLNWIERLTTDQKVMGSTPIGRTINREVAQLGRAFGLGPRGCRFKSCLPDH